MFVIFLFIMFALVAFVTYLTVSSIIESCNEIQNYEDLLKDLENEEIMYHFLHKDNKENFENPTITYASGTYCCNKKPKMKSRIKIRKR